MSLLLASLLLAADFETVVTGTRTSRTLSDMPVATDVIKKSEIDDAGAENVANVLDDYPGLDVSRGFSGAGIRVQGLDPQYTLILIDGERLQGRVNGTLDLARLMVDDIERIEVIRGPASALYGSDALGGVINIITTRARRPIEARAHLRYGYGSTLNPLHNFDVSGSVASKIKGFNLKLSGGYHRQNAFDLDPSDRATNGNGFWQGNAALRATYTVGGHELVLRTEYTRRDQNGIDVAGSGAILGRFNATETFVASFAPSFRLSDTGDLKLIVAYTLFRDQFLRDAVSSPEPEYQENRQQLGQLQGIFTQRFTEDHVFSVGLEGLLERNTSQRLNVPPGFGTRARVGVYAQHEWTIVRSPLVMVVPGVRLDGDTQFGAQPSPKVTLRIDPIPGLALRASYGLGFRAPSFQELYLQFANESVGYLVQGNPQLRPELSQALNASIEYTPISWVTLGASFYRNELENLISAIAISQGADVAGTVFTYTNVARARTQGVELRSQWRPFPGMVADLTYTYLDAQDLERKRVLDGRAAHRFNFGLNYRYERSGTGGMIRGTLVGDRVYYLDQDLGLTERPTYAKAYVSLDLRLSQRMGKYGEVFAGIDNIMNAGDARFLPLTPRMFYAGITGKY